MIRTIFNLYSPKEREKIVRDGGGGGGRCLFQILAMGGSPSFQDPDPIFSDQNK